MRTNTEGNLQQNCNKIAHLSCRLFSPYLVKRNISRFAHNSSNASIKVMKLRRNTLQQMFRMFDFSYETRTEIISPLISRSINATLLDHFNQMPFQLIDIRHRFPKTCFWMSVSLCVSGYGAVVWFTCSQGWKVNGAYYCDVKELLPDICQAAGDFDLISSTELHDSGFHTRHNMAS